MSDGVIVVVPILAVLIGSGMITQYRLGRMEAGTHERFRELDRKVERIFRKIGRMNGA